MKLVERTFSETSGITQINPNLYVVYVENEKGKKVRILDNIPAVGLAVDFPLDALLPLIRELIDVYNTAKLASWQLALMSYADMNADESESPLKKSEPSPVAEAK